MDRIGWYIATLHQMIGHDKAAAVLGQPAGDKAECVLCQYEAEPTRERRERVIAALGVPVNVNLDEDAPVDADGAAVGGGMPAGGRSGWLAAGGP